MADKVKKSEATRAKLIETATALFEQHGFAATTMRMIATEAGVSVGNAYYYFASKEELIQGYYANLNEEFFAKIDPKLAEPGTFEDRFKTYMDVWLAHIAPTHNFAADLFSFAADPKSSMSPFSEQSTATRESVTARWTALVEGSDKFKVSKELRERLPELLWLFQLGVTVFFVYDASPKQAKTKVLIKGATPLLAKLISLSRVPVLRGTVDDMLGLIDKLDPRR